MSTRKSQSDVDDHIGLPNRPSCFAYSLTRYTFTYDANRAVFDILYEDNDEEEVDFLELGDILIMGKEFGDKDEHKGMKRAEVTAQLGKEALIAAVAEEAMASHGRTSHGEERPKRRVTFEDNLHPCAHVGTMTSSSIPACDCGTCLNGGTGAGAPSG